MNISITHPFSPNIKQFYRSKLRSSDSNIGDATDFVMDESWVASNLVVATGHMVRIHSPALSLMPLVHSTSQTGRPVSI